MKVRVPAINLSRFNATRNPVTDFDYRPLDPESVNLVLRGIVREATQGMCEPGRNCFGRCDCFADKDTFINERLIAEHLLRDGVRLINGTKR